MPDATGMTEMTLLTRTRSAAHPGCLFCAPQASGWPALALRDDGAGGVVAEFACPPATEGYPGLVHGGVAAGLLDAAMTNALFVQGVTALTGRLSVRYREPLRLACTATVTARSGERRNGWWQVRGEIRQEGAVMVEGEAWFRERA